MLKLEFGGGVTPRRDGFLNVDQLDVADIKIDLSKVGAFEIPLPWPNDSVDEVYSSHCFEHLSAHGGLIQEIARVCKLGAPVEIRVPHYLQQLAMVLGHVSTVTEQQVIHWCRAYPHHWFPKERCDKRFALIRTDYIPNENLAYVKQNLHPTWSDSDIMRYVPDTCHELRFHMLVVENR